MQNGKYEDEIELLHLRNAELEPRNQEMDDVASLKEDVHLYYHHYRETQLEVMELEEVVLKLRESGGCPSDEVISLQDELANLKKRSGVANPGQGIVSEASRDHPDLAPTLQGENSLSINEQLGNNHQSPNSSFTSASTLSYPADAPTSGWFFEAFHYLNIALEPQYLDLLRIWMDYERKNCQVHASGLHFAARYSDDPPLL
ncbi:MAG: hypothetical protein NXY57DRAFT_1043799 [Lentinula lateritia]|nr:MAG: hypothetical protein NXY57DRAFT_1043799 [Lentinula lateritia]